VKILNHLPKYLTQQTFKKNRDNSIKGYRIWWIREDLTNNPNELEKLAQELNDTKCEGTRLYPTACHNFHQGTRYIAYLYEQLWG